jgi:hypothetical protein
MNREFLRYEVTNIETGEVHEAANAAACESLLERLTADGSSAARWRVRVILPEEGARARPSEQGKTAGEKEAENRELG